MIYDEATIRHGWYGEPLPGDDPAAEVLERLLTLEGLLCCRWAASNGAYTCECAFWLCEKAVRLIVDERDADALRWAQDVHAQVKTAPDGAEWDYGEENA